MGTRIDMTGRKIGELTVISYEYTIRRGHCSIAYWKCKCSCGNEKIVAGTELRAGRTRTCGGTVHRKEWQKKHGLTNSRIHQIWTAMKQRCYNQNADNYNRYGGKGVTVCDEWKENFQAFYDWAMANGYRDDLTIDRIDSNGDYEPSNCKWSTNLEQANNKRCNINITYNGETHTIAEWSRITKIPYGTLRRRIVDAKWDIETALTTKTKGMV